jgi:hypothetical protein
MVMKETLEDAVILYRQDAESLLIAASPALVLGPLLVVASASGLIAGIVGPVVIALLYLGVFAACTRAAASLLGNEEPEPLMAYFGVLRRLMPLARSLGPVALVLAVGTGGGAALGHLGYPELGLALALGAAVGAVLWGSRHGYEPALLLAHRLTVEEARDVSDALPSGGVLHLFILELLVGAPLLVAALISLGLGVAIKPVFGGAVFAAAAAVWLPFAALALTGACERIVAQAEASSWQMVPARQ